MRVEYPHAVGRWSRWLLALAAVGLILVWAAPHEAAAHAAYVESTPGYAEELSTSPEAVSVRFTQDLFRRDGANTITVTGEDGSVVAVGEPVVDNADRRRLSVAVLGSLAPGRYVVSWTNLSADDGDDDDGRYPFYVGRSATAAEQETDAALASDQLIDFPDEDAGEATDGPSAPSLTPRPPSSAAASDDGGIAGGVVALAVVTGIAMASLIGARFGWRR
jgi:methionine-rich copper-binding protein CopC